MQQDETSQTETLGQRLSVLATQLGELAGAVSKQERRQQERDQALKLALTQITAVSSNLRDLVGQAGSEPAAANSFDQAPDTQMEETAPEEGQGEPTGEAAEETPPGQWTSRENGEGNDLTRW